MQTLATVFPYLIGFMMAVVLAILLFGVAGMLRGTEFNKRHGNMLMRLRVAAQAVTIVLFAIYMLFIDK
ncbi:MAG: twin transmembrane helix small protein [Alphaproteobacteria bacterium]